MEAHPAADWNYPTRIRFGAGRIRELSTALRALGMLRPLLVTDRGLANSTMVRDALAACEEEGLSVECFSEISSNPTGEQIEAGVRRYRDTERNGMIAFGGGSALDAGKAIGFLSAQERPLWDFEDVGENYLRARVLNLPACIAIPTTAGTGSEVGRASVITDTGERIKKIIFHPSLLPELVIADPQLTVGLPPRLTGATGMDALSHSMEAYFARGYHPLAQGIAVEGMRLVFASLPQVMTEPENLQARGHMLAASLAGATAFQKGLGAMHALAHPLGALYDAHHGTLNAILMPYVLDANRNAIEAGCDWLTNALQFDARGVDGLIREVLELRRQTGTPETLAELGIGMEDAAQIGRMAASDPSAGGNPVAFDAADYEQIFRKAVAGELEVSA